MPTTRFAGVQFNKYERQDIQRSLYPRMNTSDLAARHCEPCHSGTPPLTDEELTTALTALPHWRLSQTGQHISREFRFKDFHQTMAFVNALAWIAHREDHHPDLEVGYRRCLVSYSTHAIGGLSENDLICAARIDALIG